MSLGGLRRINNPEPSSPRRSVRGSWWKNPRRVGGSQELANLPVEEYSAVFSFLFALGRAGFQGHERREPEAAPITGRGKTLEGNKTQEGIGAKSD